MPSELKEVDFALALEDLRDCTEQMQEQLTIPEPTFPQLHQHKSYLAGAIEAAQVENCDAG